MAQSIHFKIQPTIFDRRKNLILDPDFIEFDPHFVTDPPIRFSKSEILEFRYGVKWISGIEFTIGRIYCIDIKCIDNQIIKLRLKSLYGIRKIILGEKYSQIVNTLYNYYFDDISRFYLERFAEGEDFEILGVRFKPNGVILKNKVGFIDWENLGRRGYTTYFTLNYKLDRTKYNTFNYLEDWNAGVLYSVTHNILKEKGFLNS